MQQKLKSGFREAVDSVWIGSVKIYKENPVDHMSFTYVLIMELLNDTKIAVGKLGTILFKKGTYIYVGSAPSEKRLERHLKENKKLFWHIDYFLEKAHITRIYMVEGRECDVAQKIDLPYIKGFGCSDCTCLSHLFYGNLPKSIKAEQYY